MRLIDADNIIKILNTFIENTNDIEIYKDYNYSYRRCKKLILDEPTAYDVEKVVEELKRYRKDYAWAENRAYNKAIDDFAAYANTMPIVEDEDGYKRPMHLEEMAETLKRK